MLSEEIYTLEKVDIRVQSHSSCGQKNATTRLRRCWVFPSAHGILRDARVTLGMGTRSSKLRRITLQSLKYSINGTWTTPLCNFGI